MLELVIGIGSRIAQCRTGPENSNWRKRLACAKSPARADARAIMQSSRLIEYTPGCWLFISPFII